MGHNILGESHLTYILSIVTKPKVKTKLLDKLKHQYTVICERESAGAKKIAFGFARHLTWIHHSKDMKHLLWSFTLNAMAIA